jgi:mannose-1-phosphate guanylyltransferase
LELSKRQPASSIISMEIYALILAGGEGKRFWPLSRSYRPKQFLSLIGGGSMIRQTVDRVLPLIPIDRVFVVTLEKYAVETLKHIPELPPRNLILEPEGKNTASAIAIGAVKIKKLYGDVLTAVFPADHAIGDADAFRETLIFGAEVANTKLPNGELPLVVFGVRPRRPETGYGYIKEGATIVAKNGHRAKEVMGFFEKPDLDTAKGFLDEGGYYWNSGMFVWRNSSILKAFNSVVPNWGIYLDSLLDGMDTPSEKRILLDFYNSIESNSIDKLILERWANTVLVPIDFFWSDLGSWQALDEFLRRDPEENVFMGEELKGVTVDSSGCFLMGEKKVIAAVGVKNLVIVDTDDAVLVMDKFRSQEVKSVVDLLEGNLKIKGS